MQPFWRNYGVAMELTLWQKLPTENVYSLTQINLYLDGAV